MSCVAPFPPVPILPQLMTAVNYKWRDFAIKTHPDKIKGNFYLPYSLGSKTHKSTAVGLRLQLYCSQMIK